MANVVDECEKIVTDEIKKIQPALENALAEVVLECEKSVTDELKKIEPMVEKAITQVVDASMVSCWGWLVHIFRIPKVPSPPKSGDVLTLDGSSTVPSVPASV